MKTDEERLQQMYGEKDDGALEEMWANREDLTEVAEAALTSVMRSRHLPMTRGEEAGTKPTAPAVEENERLLWTFGDMYQAKRAIQLLEDAEITYKLNDLSEGGAASSWRGGGSAWMQLIVAVRDIPAAKKTLQDGMGLFPAAEGKSASQSDVPTGAWVSVLMLDAETEMTMGLAAVQALARTGVSFLWHDGRDMPEGLADAQTISIEVREEAYDKAAAVVHGASASRR